jgi:hypothetical protein
MVFIGSYATVGQLVNMSFSECEAISKGIARVDRDTVQYEYCIDPTQASVQLLLNSVAPPAAIATVNGIAQAICCVVKSVFPASVNALFALSVSHQLLGGYLAWVFMAFMAGGVFVASLFAPEERYRAADKRQTGGVTEAEAEQA